MTEYKIEIFKSEKAHPAEVLKATLEKHLADGADPGTMELIDNETLRRRILVDFGTEMLLKGPETYFTAIRLTNWHNRKLEELCTTITWEPVTPMQPAPKQIKDFDAEKFRLYVIAFAVRTPPNGLTISPAWAPTVDFTPGTCPLAGLVPTLQARADNIDAYWTAEEIEVVYRRLAALNTFNSGNAEELKNPCSPVH